MGGQGEKMKILLVLVLTILGAVASINANAQSIHASVSCGASGVVNSTSGLTISGSSPDYGYPFLDIDTSPGAVLTNSHSMNIQTPADT